MASVTYCRQYVTQILTITKLTHFYLQVSNSRSGGIWIGATDERTESHWTDTNGRAIGFTAWDKGEPNNKDNEDCGLTNWDGKPLWNDEDCEKSHDKVPNYACQYGK